MIAGGETCQGIDRAWKKCVWLYELEPLKKAMNGQRVRPEADAVAVAEGKVG
jgi:hypothetical protein